MSTLSTPSDTASSETSSTTTVTWETHKANFFSKHSKIWKRPRVLKLFDEETGTTQAYKVLRLGHLGEGGCGSVDHVLISKGEDVWEEAALKCIPKVNTGSYENEVRMFKELNGGGDQFATADLWGKRWSQGYTITRVAAFGSLADVLHWAKRFFVPLATQDNSTASGHFFAHMVSRDGALRIIRRILKAVDELHKHDVLHRDLKPGNILCTGRAIKNGFLSDVSITIADFGLSEFMQDGEGVGRCGTTGYVAPEEVFDEKSDIFSVGWILAELLTGLYPPDVESSTPKFSFERVTGNFELEANLYQLVQSLTAKNPCERLGASQALRIVESLLEDFFDEDVATPPYNPPWHVNRFTSRQLQEMFPEIDLEGGHRLQNIANPYPNANHVASVSHIRFLGTAAAARVPAPLWANNWGLGPRAKVPASQEWNPATSGTDTDTDYLQNPWSVPERLTFCESESESQDIADHYKDPIPQPEQLESIDETEYLNHSDIDEICLSQNDHPSHPDISSHVSSVSDEEQGEICVARRVRFVGREDARLVKLPATRVEPVETSFVGRFKVVRVVRHIARKSSTPLILSELDRNAVKLLPFAVLTAPTPFAGWPCIPSIRAGVGIPWQAVIRLGQTLGRAHESAPLTPARFALPAPENEKETKILGREGNGSEQSELDNSQGEASKHSEVDDSESKVDTSERDPSDSGTSEQSGLSNREESESSNSEQSELRNSERDSSEAEASRSSGSDSACGNVASSKHSSNSTPTSHGENERETKRSRMGRGLRRAVERVRKRIRTVLTKG
ncbi:kinase-like protein [Cutaneotrichosporon oleaginosum]|uniref:Kinase-like protein n=1 Tax=Cutaneotrichosporon oleaginosum TaxID=879819 RepID=A0A0J0XRN1_9TREE|nr:kinase-like protein [Cutaneotrichosporon oleaginosum]KLT43745.1 kinase-like protein [Cutaneotrichosporon oleaginosum]TXT05162.1 hypothetical protein COLE_06482 [Cutaneotrichosporon oleaginosum]